ncbi:hypothetical protein H1S01_17025 [Heliobacterium chlorum]|uniref:NB-ARC domain-containing protein n=1 Tax=Heliobacterium chlorum TaxID=2698 RepID=A0ABR7T5W5_HELCL|nr:FxSxx-COOH system tetratricopeptide repeat protein [Heliobacterium chlorum]MBC9786170.1 hypothetical protein [Heliobacterium chlorum]
MLIRVQPCELQGIFASRAYIDLVGLKETHAKNKLLGDIQTGRTKPEQKPLFPGSSPIHQKPRFPGSLPDIHNIPHARNINFTGRNTCLNTIHKALASGEPFALTQAITGLGGIGKTQMALEYAYRYAGDYDIIWWLRAEQSALLAEDYAKLALQLKLIKQAPDEALDTPLAVEAARSYLEQNERWLLIFDNAQENETIEDLYLPRGGGGHILITSRNPNWGGLAHTLPIQTWERKESIAFLRKRTGQIDDANQDQLAHELGDLPLSLEQAAAYANKMKISLNEYHELWKSHCREMLEQETPAFYHKVVATTWYIAYEQICETPAADLLNLLSFFSPDSIPEQLIRAGSYENVSEALTKAVANNLKWNDAVWPLLQYSMVERKEKNFSVHRLVQAVLGKSRQKK